MNIKFYFFGKKREILDLEREYIKRLNFKHSFEIIDLMPSGHADPVVAKRQEAKKILEKINDKQCLVAFDERGKKYDSVEFSKRVEQLSENFSEIVFVMGGAQGLDQAVLVRANQIVSFGAMVWTKNLFRLMALEQLYRASEIQSGSGFHKS